MATFNLIKITLVDIHPNPDPSHSPSNSNTVSNQMRAIYMNSRSIKALVDDNNVAGKKISKLSFFQNLVYTEQYDIACVCETCLNDSILDNEILPGYY